MLNTTVLKIVPKRNLIEIEEKENIQYEKRKSQMTLPLSIISIFLT